MESPLGQAELTEGSVLRRRPDVPTYVRIRRSSVSPGTDAGRTAFMLRDSHPGKATGRRTLQSGWHTAMLMTHITTGVSEILPGHGYEFPIVTGAAKS